MVAGVAVLEEGRLVGAEVCVVARAEIIFVFAGAEIPLEPVPPVVVAAPESSRTATATVRMMQQKYQIRNGV